MNPELAIRVLPMSKDSTKPKAISTGEQGGVTSKLYLYMLGNAFSAVSRRNHTNCIAVPPRLSVTGHYVALFIRRGQSPSFTNAARKRRPLLVGQPMIYSWTKLQGSHQCKLLVCT